MPVRWTRARNGLYLAGDAFGAPIKSYVNGDGSTSGVVYASADDGANTFNCQISAWSTVTLDLPSVCQDGIALIGCRCVVTTGGTSNTDAAVWAHVRKPGSGWGITPGGLVPPDFTVVGQNSLNPPFQAYARLYSAAIVGPPAWPAVNETDAAVQNCETPMNGFTIEVGWGCRGTITAATVDFFCFGAWRP